MNRFCCGIPLSTIITDKPVFPHGLNGIFISQRAVIGKNCVIFQQVTIGSNSLKDSQKIGAPVLGDNVYIGAGAKIIGKITIGSNVRIGANAIVVMDIPDNSTVVMNKPRIIIHDEKRDNEFI
jgi:serine O-acetyltransferase